MSVLLPCEQERAEDETVAGFISLRTRLGAVFVIFAAIMGVAAFGIGLTGVRKDPSVDAFVSLDHPAAIAREKARAIFGLEDPVVVALAPLPGAPATVFTPEILGALQDLHEGVRLIPGVRKNDVVSIADRKWISGDNGDLLVEPILPEGDLTIEIAAQALARVRDMPMMIGLLASEEGDLATILIPVDDPDHAGDIYTEIVALAEAIVSPYADVHVAGVAAMNARLGAMVDGDTRIFVPAAVLTVFLILVIALRRWTALAGPLFVVIASAVVGIGAMGWLDARYYLITTALPVIIMAIAVADSLHVTSYYMRARRLDASINAATAARIAIGKTWLPVTLTTVTTIAGFIGLSFGAAMKPISEFGLFAAVGSGAAWVFSLTALPAILILTNLRPSTAHKFDNQGGGGREGGASSVERIVLQAASVASRRPVAISLALLATLIGLGTSAREASFDYERKRYFLNSDPVRIADARINAELGGVNFLDVVISTEESAGLMTPGALQAIAALKQEIRSLPGVVKITAIDDYVSLMHQALNGAPFGALPTRANAPAQYMLLFEASAPPDEFKSLIDYEHQQALVRAQLSSDQYSATRDVVRALNEHLAEWSRETGLTAAVSGRVAVNEGWMSRLAENHFRGLGLAAAFVFVASILAFRAIGPAVIVMVPVAVGILFVYAAMGIFRIDIAPATSMTAAIATGLGVDFGTHLIAHIRRRMRAGASLTEAMSGEYAVVGRACFFSAIALATALAVICLSSAPPLRWFGMLVAAAAIGSLVGAIYIIPAALSLIDRLTKGARP